MDDNTQQASEPASGPTSDTDEKFELARERVEAGRRKDIAHKTLDMIAAGQLDGATIGKLQMATRPPDLSPPDGDGLAIEIRAIASHLRRVNPDISARLDASLMRSGWLP